MALAPTKSEIAHSKAVREMFAGIAPRYDVLNHVLSLNIDKRWRRLVSHELRPVLNRPDAVVLDVACGTGDLSIELQSAAKACVIGTDFCRPMLALARDKSNGDIPYVEGDAMSLPFEDGRFDALTIAFGLRNLPNVTSGLNELRRVLKPGGKLVVLECSTPIVPGFRTVFDFYFSHILPRIGGAISGSRGAYEYLPESVSKFPNQTALAAMIEKAGFAAVKYQNLTGGIVAIHSGVRN